MKSSGFCTKKFKNFRIQFYYPKFHFYKTDIYFSFDNCIRIMNGKDIFGFGFQVFGFGLGFDYENKSI